MRPERTIRFLLLWLLSHMLSEPVYSQELFVFTEPASNMPAKSVGIRMSNWLMPDQGKTGYQFIPEIMWGANKNLMLHAEAFSSNQHGSFHGDGIGAYGKYRIYTADDVNKHFRMALYGRISYNNREIRQEEIDLSRNNSGYGFGMVATQLLHKQAISSSLGFMEATNNNRNKLPSAQPDKAVQLSLSTGRLLLPKEYTSFRQTNVNFLLELLGQHLIGSDKYFLDLAPAIQFIFNSQLRIDLGYKHQLYSNMIRDQPDGFMLRAEYLLFNVF